MTTTTRPESVSFVCSKCVTLVAPATQEFESWMNGSELQYDHDGCPVDHSRRLNDAHPQTTTVKAR